MIRNIFIAIRTYIAAIMAVIGLVTLIWAGGMKSERKTVEKEGVNKNLIEIKTEQTEQSKKIDALYVLVNSVKIQQDNLSKSQFVLITNQNALRNSWVSWLANQKSLTKEDFIKYMNGLEFQITPPDPDSNNYQKKIKFSISVEKMEKPKN